MAAERLQKILAKAGIASRRAAERLILDGRVRVNGRVVTELGARANAVKDRVEVDGKRLVAERPVYYLMHKPRGVVTTLDDPEGRETIKDLLANIPERVYPVGRLDYQTSGVLLLTNDGDMAQALLHPTRRVPKTYAVKIQGQLDDRGVMMLREGVVLEDGDKTAPAEVALLRSDDKHTFLELTISEGKNRQIHRMLEALGRRVLRLARISFADLGIAGLRAGQIRPLGPTELADLKQNYLNPQKKVRGPYGAPTRSELEAAAFEAKHGPARPVRRRAPRVQSEAERAVRREAAIEDDRAGASEPKRATRSMRETSVARDGRNARNARDPGQPQRVTRAMRTTRGFRDTKSARAAREARGVRDTRDVKSTRGVRDTRDTRDTRDVKSTRGVRDTRDAKSVRVARDARSRDPERNTRGGRREPAKTAPERTRTERVVRTPVKGGGARRGRR